MLQMRWDSWLGGTVVLALIFTFTAKIIVDGMLPLPVNAPVMTHLGARLPPNVVPWLTMDNGDGASSHVLDLEGVCTLAADTLELCFVTQTMSFGPGCDLLPEASLKYRPPSRASHDALVVIDVPDQDDAEVAGWAALLSRDLHATARGSTRLLISHHVGPFGRQLLLGALGLSSHQILYPAPQLKVCAYLGKIVWYTPHHVFGLLPPSATLTLHRAVSTFQLQPAERDVVVIGNDAIDDQTLHAWVDTQNLQMRTFKIREFSGTGPGVDMLRHARVVVSNSPQQLLAMLPFLAFDGDTTLLLTSPPQGVAPLNLAKSLGCDEVGVRCISCETPPCPVEALLKNIQLSEHRTPDLPNSVRSRYWPNLHAAPEARPRQSFNHRPATVPTEEASAERVDKKEDAVEEEEVERMDPDDPGEIMEDVLRDHEWGRTFPVTSIGRGAQPLPSELRLEKVYDLDPASCADSDFYKIDKRSRWRKYKKCFVAVLKTDERVCASWHDLVDTAGGNSDMAFCYRVGSDLMITDMLSRVPCNPNDGQPIRELSRPAVYAIASGVAPSDVGHWLMIGGGMESPHFFQDTIPALGVMLHSIPEQERGDVNLVLFNDDSGKAKNKPYGWASYLLQDLMHVDSSRLVWFQTGERVCSPGGVMYFFSPIYVFGGAPSVGFNLLHRLTLGQDPRPSERNALVFLSRSDASNGRVSENEPQAVQALQQWITSSGLALTFHEYTASKATKEVTVDLFRRTRIADQDTHVLEILIGGTRARNFRNMAMGCNLSYTSVSLPCPPDHETTEGDGCFSDINQDIDIDLMLSGLNRIAKLMAKN